MSQKVAAAVPSAKSQPETLSRFAPVRFAPTLLSRDYRRCLVRPVNVLVRSTGRTTVLMIWVTQFESAAGRSAGFLLSGLVHFSAGKSVPMTNLALVPARARCR